MGLSVHADDGGGVPVHLSPGLVLTGVAVIATLVLLAGVVAAVAYWRMKRSGRLRRLTAAAEAQLRPPGPRRDLADLQLELTSSLDGARMSVGTLPGAESLSGDLMELSTRLETSARPLIARLDQARQLSDNQLEKVLPTLFTQIRAVQRIAERIQGACDNVAAGQVGVDLQALLADTDDEIAKIDATVQAYRELSKGT